ncbi:MAG: response regulator [Chloroflexi bacterium]|nr:response regulator [Chloroflexota bacterium]
MTKRILVVDDDPAFVEFTRQALERQGYEVCVCQEAERAIERVREWSPDLVLLDLRMPERTGWEILELLRLRPTTRRIPIIITTGQVLDVKASLPLIHERHVDVLFKPFELDELLHKVEQCIGPASAAEPPEPGAGPGDADHRG